MVGAAELPAPEELENHSCVRNGWLYDVKVWASRPEETFYDEAFLKERFVRYNWNVRDYFRLKNNLLVVNVAEDGAYQKLCAFLGGKPEYMKMPHENIT